MHTIDRMKVQHARNSFFNPETNSLLPSLDHMEASKCPGSVMQHSTMPGSMHDTWGDFS